MKEDNNKENSRQESSDSKSKGPVGQGNYIVQQGDCMESIAYDHGFFWKTIWNLPENSELKEKRKDPNVLLETDRITIPPLREKHEVGGTEARHRFRRKGVPSKLKIILKTCDEPLASVKYVLEIDGVIQSGLTKNDGSIEVGICPSAKKATLKIGNDGEIQSTYDIVLGGIDPITEISGIQGRLSNLGFPCDITGEMNDQTAYALSLFQEHHGLKPTGQIDNQTSARLNEAHVS